MHVQYIYTYIFIDDRQTDDLAVAIDVYTLRQVLFVLQHWQREKENTHPQKKSEQ